MKVILQSVTGSQAYGLAHKDSDIDQLGIYLLPINELIGLGEPKLSLVQKNPDVTLHELSKYCNLALKSNPTVLELMYATDVRRSHSVSQLLLDARDAFPSSKYARAAYGGYAAAQQKKIGEWIWANKEQQLGIQKKIQKWGRHCIRLLLQGQQLIETGSLSLDVSDERDYLYEMGRAAENDWRKFFDEYKKLSHKLDTAKSVLPELPDRDRINSIVLEMRWAAHNQA